MEDIYQILSDNLVRLRKSKQLTQAELADILKYSDKTVSKWENGEALPTLETLVRISDFYNIPIDTLLKESVDTDEYHQIEKIRKTNKAVIALLGVLAVWIIAIVTFVIGCIRLEPVFFWQIFIWAVPVSFMLGIIFSSLWNRRLIYLLLSLFLWTFLTAVFLQFLSKNLYMIFFIGVPLQIVIILTRSLRYDVVEETAKRQSKKKQKNNNRNNKKEETV